MSTVSGQNGDGPQGGSSMSRTPVAQLVEQRIPNPQVAGSSPSRRDSKNGDGREPGTQIEFGLFKYGQGYWVRVLTAVFAGLLVLAGALWAGDQLQAVRLPTPTWSMTIDSKAKTAPLAVGDAVQLVDIRGDKPQTLGTAVVAQVVSDTQIVVGSVVLDSKSASVLDAGRMVSAGGLIADVSGARGVPIFDPRYLSLGVGSLIVILGVGLIYWHVGRRPRSVDFLIAVDGEMKRVNWSTRQTIIDSTMVVIGATFLIAAVLFAADWFLQWVYAMSGVVKY